MTAIFIYVQVRLKPVTAAHIFSNTRLMQITNEDHIGGVILKNKILAYDLEIY
jgi:hypothetical protein